ncbi:HU family DNA-binding protein [Parabacteroides pacaensis]|uniref:HU family DNA-binding protein n=1 Tax=Parabacteroides pacaensis TaxID=2086575 RepID=UPI000D0FC4D0|nr:HU family DNA-binding protein [Parabacteroides pacaensis]
MVKVRFGVYDAPKNSGKKNGVCARVISYGTKRDREIYEYISDCCSLTSSDIKGVLEALTEYIGMQISYGYNVELDGLGHFSAAVRTKQEINENGKEVFRVNIDKVNFRCSNRLKEMIKRESPQKVERYNQKKNTLEERKGKMLEYLQANPYMNVTQYARQNGCTPYRAGIDIKQFVEEGIIKAEGYKTHKVYRLL